MSYNDVRNVQKFGTMLKKECVIDLEVLKDKAGLMIDEANIFYELYLQDSFKNLIDVPVLIRNYRNLNGEKPNESGTEPQE